MDGFYHPQNESMIEEKQRTIKFIEVTFRPVAGAQVMARTMAMAVAVAIMARQTDHNCQEASAVFVITEGTLSLTYLSQPSGDRQLWRQCLP